MKGSRMAPSDQLEEVSEHGGSGSGSLGKVKEDSRGEDRRGGRRRRSTPLPPHPQRARSRVLASSRLTGSGNTHHRLGIILSDVRKEFNTNSRRYLFRPFCNAIRQNKDTRPGASCSVFLPFTPSAILGHRSTAPDISMSPFRESDIAP